VINLVLAPHECFALHDASDRELNRRRRKHPDLHRAAGTPCFFIGLSDCHRAAAVFDINVNGVDAVRRRGIDARPPQRAAPYAHRAGPRRGPRLVFGRDITALLARSRSW
jgi:hypothetical protein